MQLDLKTNKRARTALKLSRSSSPSVNRGGGLGWGGLLAGAREGGVWSRLAAHVLWKGRACGRPLWPCSRRKMLALLLCVMRISMPSPLEDTVRARTRRLFGEYFLRLLLGLGLGG